MKNGIRLYILVFIGFALFFTSNCKKDESLPVPVLATNTVSNITQTTATCGGSITSDGGLAVTARGVCWSNRSDPTLADFKTIDGAGAGDFLSNMSDLIPNNHYLVRAYATNSAGTGYGIAMSFTTAIEQLPVLTTTSISNLLSISATCGGNITNDGGGYIIARGVCWSTSQNPVVTDNHTSDGTGNGIFTSSIIGLSKFTTYFVRAYATNNAGTAYGQELSFITGYGTLSDIDGNAYKTVKIGTQVWMAENLKTETYSNGDYIATTIPITLDIFGDTEPKYQWDPSMYYEGYLTTYGRLYTWYAVTDDRSVCPEGWHVPTDAEWTVLTDYLLGEPVAGDKLKEAGFAHWSRSLPNTGTNETGFTALPGGLRAGYFGQVEEHGYWWSSTERDPNYAWHRNIDDNSSVRRFYDYKEFGYSVRCVQD